MCMCARKYVRIFVKDRKMIYFVFDHLKCAYMVYVYVHVSAYVYAYVRINIHKCPKDSLIVLNKSHSNNTFTHAYTHIHIHKYMHTYVHACIHTYTHTHIHTYIHTLQVLSASPGVWNELHSKRAPLCTCFMRMYPCYSCVYIHIHTHIYIQSYVHDQIHMYP